MFTEHEAHGTGYIFLTGKGIFILQQPFPLLY